MSGWKYEMNAVCPQSASGGRWTIGVSPKDIQRLQSNGHITKLARLGLVKEVAEDPAIIVQGWDRPDQEQCFVYVGYPDKDFRSGTIETPSLAPVNCCFLVFVYPMAL